jgi:ABC-type phosphate/phosphonate transport system permease subunit
MSSPCSATADRHGFGAGGLGQQIQIAISLFLENKLPMLILAIYLMVTLVNYLSACLRRRLL